VAKSVKNTFMMSVSGVLKGTSHRIYYVGSTKIVSAISAGKAKDAKDKEIGEEARIWRE